MIPSICHFIWFGPDIPWAYTIAIRAAAKRGGFDRIVLHGDHQLESLPHIREVVREHGLEFMPIEPDTLLAEDIGVAGLRELYDNLSKSEARANLIRAALLYRYGGIYLDTDVITIASFDSVRQNAVFCGTERIIYPSRVCHSRSRITRRYRSILGKLRNWCRDAPQGYRFFRAISFLYYPAVNNAVFGAEPGHPFLLDLLKRMAALDKTQQTKQYALGTHLLQNAVRDYGTRRDLRVLPPQACYPLPPVVSEHWFRLRRTPRLETAISRDTICVHWYASLVTDAVVSSIDERYLAEHASDQLFSLLATRALGCREILETDRCP